MQNLWSWWRGFFLVLAESDSVEQLKEVIGKEKIMKVDIFDRGVEVGFIMDLDNKIFVAGHNGMVGSAIVRRLKNLGASQIVTAIRSNLT